MIILYFCLICFHVFFLHGSYRFDNLLFKDFSGTFQGLLTTFKGSIYTGTIEIFSTVAPKKQYLKVQIMSFNQMKTTISSAIFTIHLRKTKVNTFPASSYISLMALPVKWGGYTRQLGKKSLKAWLKTLNKKH